MCRWNYTSLVPRPSRRQVFDCLQYGKTGWWVGRPGNEARPMQTSSVCGLRFWCGFHFTWFLELSNRMPARTHTTYISHIFNPTTSKLSWWWQTDTISCITVIDTVYHKGCPDHIFLGRLSPRANLWSVIHLAIKKQFRNWFLGIIGVVYWATMTESIGIFVAMTLYKDGGRLTVWWWM